MLRVRPRVWEGLSDDDEATKTTREPCATIHPERSGVRPSKESDSSDDPDRHERLRREVENEIETIVRLKLDCLSDEDESEAETDGFQRGKAWAGLPEPSSTCDLEDGLSSNDDDDDDGDDVINDVRNDTIVEENQSDVEDEIESSSKKRTKKKRKKHGKKGKTSKKERCRKASDKTTKGQKLDEEEDIADTPDYDEPLTTSRGGVLLSQRWKSGRKVVVFKHGRLDEEEEDVESVSSTSLTFNASFESANLAQATRVGDFEYDLQLKTDVNTSRHTQWYYFEVGGTVAGVTYQFNIVNLLKKDSLYNHGLQPLFLSKRETALSGTGWRRVGTCISYTYNSELPGKNFYKLSWRMEFPYAGDTCSIAHCYPYTFTNLQDYLTKISLDRSQCEYCKIDVLCETKGERPCPLLTITDFSGCLALKKCVFISGRVHPGETNSSWIVQGLIDFLLSSHPEAQELRESFIFKIIPMLNPDGVAVGNYRCSLAGVDLNRQYINPNKFEHPTVFHLKKELENTKRSHEVVVYCDFHGHSRQQNVFMYGCRETGSQTSSDIFKHKLFPWVMSQKAPETFSYSNCRYNVKKCKEGTGRVVMRRQFGILNSFTMETSFAGTTLNKIPRHFHCRDLMKIGRNFAEAVLDYWRSLNNAKVLSQYCQSLAAYLSCDEKPNSTGFRLKESRNWLSGKADTGAYSRLEELVDASESNSDSEDSCSESENDVKVQEDGCGSQKVKKKKKRRQKKKEKDKDLPLGKQSSSASSSSSSSAQRKCQEIRRSQSLPALDAKRLPAASGRTKKMSIGGIGRSYKFVNPYANRSNGGIPMFSQERMQERMRKRQEKMIIEQKERLNELTAKASTALLHPNALLGRTRRSTWDDVGWPPALPEKTQSDFVERSMSLAPRNFLFSNWWTPVTSPNCTGSPNQKLF